MAGFDPTAFAAQWASAWNRRDLDAVLNQFADDVVFSSPTAAETVGRPTVRGKAALRAYWERALDRVTSLQLTVVRTVWDASHRELGILYDREINGTHDRAVELLQVNVAGAVRGGEVFHGVVPAGESSG
jgi:ketosteroid isomerase-like protein